MAWFGRRKTEERALTRANAPTVFVPELDISAIGPHAALRIADVYACVRALADAASSLPLIAYRRTSEGRVRAGGQTQELLDNPAPATTTSGLVGQIVTTLNLQGNCFLAKYRNRDGRVAVLALLAPETVTVELERGQPVYTVLQEDGVAKVGPEDVLHIRAPLSEDGVYGLSPIRQARDTLGLSRALTDHATDTLRRGARLSGIISTPSDAVVDEDRLEQIRSEISSTWTGQANSGAVALTTGGLTFHPLAMPLADAQFVEQRQLSAQEIARIFRVPPWIIGAPSGDSMTYSNVAEQARAFITFSLRPWLVAIEQALTNDEDLSPSTVFMEFLLEGFLQADPKTRAEIYTLALNPQTGWLTRSEVRQLENYPPEEEDRP
jgi:HK97 family phage portal protein